MTAPIVPFPSCNFMCSDIFNWHSNVGDSFWYQRNDLNSYKECSEYTRTVDGENEEMIK